MCNYLPWPTPFMDGVIRGMSMLGDIERGEMLIVHIQIEGGGVVWKVHLFQNQNPLSAHMQETG